MKRVVSVTSHRECRERNRKIEKQRGATKTVQKLCKGNKGKARSAWVVIRQLSKLLHSPAMRGFDHESTTKHDPSMRKLEMLGKMAQTARCEISESET